jgi:hypothetical protein
VSDDLFDQYFALVKETEPPAIYHRWALLGVLGAWLGRSCWLPFGSGRIFPNQYIMFIGDPGARKSTAIKRACSLIHELGYDHFAPKKTSKEQYLADLTSDGPEPNKDDPTDFDILATDSTTPAESFINADEFNIFMGAGNLDFQALLGDMWDWDSPKPWQYRLKNSKSVSIFQPTINILSGNTPQSFNDCFPPASVGQGFMSRLILIYGERTNKRIPFPPAPDTEKQRAVMERLVRIRSRIVGEFARDKSATEALSLIYTSWPGVDDARFTHYNERRFTHLLKLCMLHAASRESMTIGLLDVVKSSTVLAYAESHMPKAVGEMGQSKASGAAQKIMQALHGANHPLGVKELWMVVKGDLERPADLSQVINNLLLADRVQAIDLTGGRGTGYLPKHKGVSRKVMYYDPKWLKGKELGDEQH